jgi:hypothetical protein
VTDHFKINALLLLSKHITTVLGTELGERQRVSEN